MAFGAGFGAMGVGSGPYGTALLTVPSFSVARARASSLNSVDVTFDAPPRSTDPASAKDALFVAGWSLVAVDPSGATVRLPQDVEATSDPTTVRVFFDGRLDASAVYDIAASSVFESRDGAELSGRTARFRALALPSAFAVRTVRGLYDIANPQTAQDVPTPAGKLGSYQPKSDGTLHLDVGISGIRKRVLRRLTTAGGGFIHLPDYGLLLPTKRNITPTRLRSLQQAAQQQITQEPEVSQAQVVVRRDPSAVGVVYLIAKVRLLDGTEQDITARVNVFAGADQ